MVMVKDGVPQPLRAELSRTELIRALASNLDARVITVIAPSGYGKTTLIAQYCRNSGRKTCWLDLSENDLDTRRLEHRLRQEIQGLAEIPTQTPNAPEQRTVGAALVELALELNRQPDNLDIVFDNIDLISGETAAAVGSFAESLAEGHRVLLIGHTIEHLRITRLVARGEVFDITQRELSFALEETTNYLYSRDFTGDAALVQESLAGWPAGVALTASGARLAYSHGN
ncbi:MAG: hypothetical protein HC933_03675 [Pleurocapsa sp. SU_196_0]|nr:hypothetical protein [Pleurocapsa sp. SU_196_0]